jgi:hypothetical protein
MNTESAHHTPPANARRHRERLATVQRLADRAELTDLVSRLALCLDEHRFEELASLFTEDAAILTPGGPAAGRQAVVAQARRNHDEFDRLQHNVNGVLVEFEGGHAGEGNEEGDDAADTGRAGDRAAIRANLVGVFAKSAEPLPTRVLGGRYRFQAVRTPGGWQFAQMRIEAVWRTDGVRAGLAGAGNADAAPAPASVGA